MFKFILTLSFALISAITPAEAKKNTDDIYTQLELMSNIIEKVNAYYVDDVSDTKLIENAISGMLTELDPHSSYLPPKSYDEMQEQTQGEFGGLGIEVTSDKGAVKVVAPIEGTPADKAGVEAGDYIIKIDGEDIQGQSLSDSVEKMRGMVGTKIVVTIYRESTSKTFDITIVRAKIKIRPVRSELKADGIGYVRVTTFNQATTKDLHKELKKLTKENKKELSGLVLDLRNNPGGLLDEAISVSDTFLEQGEIVSTKGRIESQNQRVYAKAGDKLAGKPVVVLINQGSASASEIVAGALQDHGRAVIVGTKSFGKGSVQTILGLPGGAGIRLTTALYYTPSGRSIQAKGIEPDVEVKQAKVEEFDFGSIARSEANLKGHIEVDEKGNKKKDVKKDKNSPLKNADAESEEDKKEKFRDFQLERAESILKALTVWDNK